MAEHSKDPTLVEYRRRLPRWGYATNDFRHGMYSHPKTEMIQRKMLQHNAKRCTSMLVVDVDREDASEAWLDACAPTPNAMIINPANGHAHFVFFLKTPMPDWTAASPKALRYLAAVDVALTRAIGGDPTYARMISKNALHPDWRTVCLREDPYTLAELAEHLDLQSYTDRRRSLPAEGLGRNCTMFEKTRMWAYRAIRDPQGWLSFDLWHRQVRGKAAAVNAEFEPPLPEAEVKAVAKSIAKWVWAHMDRSGFQQWCKRRGKIAGKRSGEVRKNQAAELAEQIRKTAQSCPALTQQDIADLHGVTRRTVYTAMRRMGNEPISDIHAFPATGHAVE